MISARATQRLGAVRSGSSPESTLVARFYDLTLSLHSTARIIDAPSMIALDPAITENNHIGYS